MQKASLKTLENDFEAAEEIYERILELNPDYAPAHVRLGLLHQASGRQGVASASLEKALELNPGQMDALGLMVRGHIREGKYNQAMKLCERQKKAVGEDTARLAYIEFLQGNILAAQRDLNGARQHLEKAIEINPNILAGYGMLARIYVQEDRIPEAIIQYERMIAKNPRLTGGYVTLGTLYEHEGNLEKAESCYRKALKIQEDFGPAANHLARNIVTRGGNIDEALTYAQIAKEKMPKSAAVMDTLGWVYYRKGSYLNAIAEFQDALEMEPDSATINYHLGLAYLGNRQRDAAKEYLKKAVSLEPGLLQGRLLLCEIYLGERSQELAREQIEASLALSPRDTRVLMQKAALNLVGRDSKAAQEAYKKVIELDPGNVPAHVRLGLLYQLTDRRDKALASLEQALVLDPNQMVALGLMLRIYLGQNKYEQAIALCERQQAAVGENTPLWAYIEYLKGNVFLAKKDLDAARRHLEKAIEINPNILMAYGMLAGIYVQEGKIPEAIGQYEKIISKNPRFVPGHMTLGTLYERKGDLEKAESYYRKALEIQDDFGPAANNLAWNIVMRGGDLDVALSYARTAKEKMPNSAAVLDTIGWIYYKKASYPNAIAEFRDALEIEPDNAVINYHLGLAYLKSEQRNAAKEYLEKALTLNQDFDGVEEAKKALAEIEGSAEPK
jgi:tetratricopeptide (TPR) repeat protein